MSNKVLIMGDPHVNSRDATVREAAFLSFESALSLAHQLGCRYACHTGDFADGPLLAPNLEAHAYLRYSRLLAEYKLKGVTFTECPAGNHDVPKLLSPGYTTAWEALSEMVYGGRPPELPLLTIDFDTRGHDHKGRDCLMEALRRKLGVLKRSNNGHLLVVAHAHWGHGRFNMLSSPLNENYYTPTMQAEITARARERGYRSVTTVLGHDHTPQDYPEHGLYVLGSPTAFTFGDEAPRRLMTFDFDTGETCFYSTSAGLSVVQAREGADLSSLAPGTAVDFTEAPPKEVTDELQARGIKFRKPRPEPQQAGKVIISSLNFVAGYAIFEERVPVREYNLEFLREAEA